MPSVIEFIAECIAKEIDLSDSESSNDQPAKPSPRLSDYFKRNPYCRRYAGIHNESHEYTIKDATTENNELKDIEANKSEQLEEEQEFILHLSENEDSQASVKQVKEDFILQLSEDEDSPTSQENIEEQNVTGLTSSQSDDQHPFSLVKNIIPRNHITVNSPPVIKCSDACIVSKEPPQTSSEDAFQEIADAKKDDAIKPYEDPKKRPSSEDTPIKYFKIFRSYFKDVIKEPDTTNPSGGGANHTVPKEIPNSNVPATSEPKNSAKRSKPVTKESGKKQSRKGPAVIEPASKNVHFCWTCRTQVESITALKQHLRQHSQNRMAHHCSICQRSFATNFGLKRHLLTHSNERRFSCSVCGTKFMRRDSLLRHRRRHFTC